MKQRRALSRNTGRSDRQSRNLLVRTATAATLAGSRTSKEIPVQSRTRHPGRRTGSARTVAGPSKGTGDLEVVDSEERPRSPADRGPGAARPGSSCGSMPVSAPTCFQGQRGTGTVLGDKGHRSGSVEDAENGASSRLVNAQKRECTHDCECDRDSWRTVILSAAKDLGRVAIHARSFAALRMTGWTVLPLRTTKNPGHAPQLPPFDICHPVK